MGVARVGTEVSRGGGSDERWAPTRGSRSDAVSAAPVEKDPIWGSRGDGHAPLRLELVRRAHGRVQHGKVELHDRGSGNRSPGARGEVLVAPGVGLFKRTSHRRIGARHVAVFGIAKSCRRALVARTLPRPCSRRGSEPCSPSSRARVAQRPGCDARGASPRPPGSGPRAPRRSPRTPSSWRTNTSAGTWRWFW